MLRKQRMLQELLLPMITGVVIIRFLLSFPHVTKRQAPPDQIGFVHIDYPEQHTLPMLVHEHYQKWSKLSSPPPTIVSALLEDAESMTEAATAAAAAAAAAKRTTMELEAVLTVWICMSEQVLDYPLLVADVRSVPETSKFVYKVGAKKHSVGVVANSSNTSSPPYCSKDANFSNGNDTQQSHSRGSVDDAPVPTMDEDMIIWYHSLPMKRFEALVFEKPPLIL
jgi:hypothetical protein